MRPSGGPSRGVPYHPAHIVPPQPGPDDRHGPVTGHDDVRVTVKVLQSGSASRRARAVVRQVLGRAGLGDDAVADAEIVVAELAANAEKHARPPYELRVFSLGVVPAWCEIVDGDPDLYEVRVVLGLLCSVEEIGLPLLAENGRGLLLAHRLSGGHCHVHPTTALATGDPGKAVAFALPVLSGGRPAFLPLPDLTRLWNRLGPTDHR
ncbi:hypothetical protein AB0395_41970 [Streptosporangium sp. NPDC051023]|uniref:ATP-binding protein n=1 Tax=Streptosporangium sp. NPDC051023 TaxID=3155410 RepID=UPI00344F36C5